MRSGKRRKATTMNGPFRILIYTYVYNNPGCTARNIADAEGVERRNVNSALAELEQADWLEVEKKYAERLQRMENTYTVSRVPDNFINPKEPPLCTMSTSPNPLFNFSWR